jgi:hypothetical protein
MIFWNLNSEDNYITTYEIHIVHNQNYQCTFAPITKYMSKKEKERFEISEMFMAKATSNRCFFGIIKRGNDHDGNPVVFSKIVMPNDGYICAQSDDQKTLGKNLDEMCIMILDRGLHNDCGKTTKIFGSDFFLN